MITNDSHTAMVSLAFHEYFSDGHSLHIIDAGEVESCAIGLIQSMQQRTYADTN